MNAKNIKIPSAVRSLNEMVEVCDRLTKYEHDRINDRWELLTAMAHDKRVSTPQWSALSDAVWALNGPAIVMN